MIFVLVAVAFSFSIGVFVIPPILTVELLLLWYREKVIPVKWIVFVKSELVFLSIFAWFVFMIVIVRNNTEIIEQLGREYDIEPDNYLALLIFPLCAFVIHLSYRFRMWYLAKRIEV